MPPQPKRKKSKSSRNQRRAHDFLTPPNLVKCGTCGEMHIHHTVCANCGSYNGRQVVEVEKKTN
ncbi:MAG TPA: 50S ribosomal protein L32 [Anaerolineales bacterium]|nr:50S ribosomal protein L32 [Anaerolineales bacterium]